MSFEKKLYDVEVTPPQSAWENISNALDDLQLEDKLKKKLVDLKSEPPVEIWNSIAKNLDEFIFPKTISEKLNQLTEVPPVDIWNKIEGQIEEDLISQKFAKHLSALEVTPPEKNWSAILSKLDNATPVIPFIKKYNRAIRYAAAAVIIGFIAWGGIKFLNTGTAKTEEAGIVKEETVKPATETPSTNTEIKTSDNPTIALSPDVKDERKKEVFASKKKERITEPNRNLIAAVNSFQNNHSGTEEIVADVNNEQRNKRTGIANNNTDTTAPRYLVYLNEEGSLMKLSKKLADLKCIYTKDGEVTQDALASLNKQICADLVKTWQEKLARAPFSSFDPLGLADILK